MCRITHNVCNSWHIIHEMPDCEHFHVRICINGQILSLLLRKQWKQWFSLFSSVFNTKTLFSCKLHTDVCNYANPCIMCREYVYSLTLSCVATHYTWNDTFHVNNVHFVTHYTWNHIFHVNNVNCVCIIHEIHISC